MFILAQGGESYAQLHWRLGGPAHLDMEVSVDYSRRFAGTEFDRWEAEYRTCVADEEPAFQQLWGVDPLHDLDWSLPEFNPTENDPFVSAAEQDTAVHHS